MKIVTSEDLSSFPPEEPPLGLDGKHKKKFAVKTQMSSGYFFQKDIYIDDELFDWSIDEEAYHWAEMQGPDVLRAVQRDICKHFLDCLSEVVGRKISLDDFQQAAKTGWI